MDLSVVICTHNPREDYLRRVLSALKAQTLPKEKWELLLIDNASKDPLAKNCDLSWHPQARHIREDKLGLTPARLRGIAESVGDLVVFLDDDNVAAPDYLEVSQGLSEMHPNLGCFGAGKIEPEFEAEPPIDLIPYVFMLALRTVKESRWSNSPTDEIIPWGAGLVVRRLICKHYRESINSCSIRQGLGRSGNFLNCCEDDEFSWLSCEMGYGKGVFPKLRITHLIDRKRVELDYLLRMAEGHSFSRAMLMHTHGHRMGTLPDLPTFGLIVKSIFRGSPSAFFCEGQRWWARRRKVATERSFEDASHDGLKRALRTINGHLEEC